MTYSLGLQTLNEDTVKKGHKSLNRLESCLGGLWNASLASVACIHMLVVLTIRIKGRVYVKNGSSE